MRIRNPMLVIVLMGLSNLGQGVNGKKMLEVTYERVEK
jgi:hypothetical protein